MTTRAIPFGALLLCAIPFAQAQCGSRIGGPDNFVVRRLQLNGLESVSAADASAITASLTGQCFNNSKELSQKVRDAFQQHGYFKAAVSGVKLDVADHSSRPSPVDASATVDPGPQYRLDEITFTSQKAFPASQLRPLVPMAPGDVFDVEKIRQGIEALRELYGNHGYINLTPVPNTEIDEAQRTIRLVFDLDEGRQFRVAKAGILAPPDVAERLYRAWPLKPGDIYNASEVERFFAENKDLMPPGARPGRNMDIRQDSATATVSIRISLCPPSTLCGPELAMPH